MRGVKTAGWERRTKGFDARDLLPLHNAVERNSIADVLRLLQFVEVDAQDPDGITPLHLSAKQNSTEIPVILLNRGADVRARTKVGYTALHYAVRESAIDVVKLLLQSGADVDAVDKFDKSALHVCESAEVGELILARGANIKLRDCYHETILHCATAFGSKEMVELCLSHGADVNALNFAGWSPLLLSVSHNHIDITKVLLDSGANIRITNIYDNSVLHHAAFENSVEMVKLLLKHSADVNIKNISGKTALKCAIQFRRFAVAKEIIRHAVKNKDPCVNEDLERNELKEFKRKCEEEITKLTETKVGDSIVSYYDFLTKNENKLVHCMANENIVKTLQKDAYKSDFPIYSDMITIQVKKARERHIVFNSSFQCFRHLFHFNNRGILVPDTFITDLVSYLSNEDLKNVVNSCAKDDSSVIM